MFIVSRSTIWNARALETRSAPKRVLGRIALFPRRGASFGFLLRLTFEAQPLRYLLPLLPFVAAMLIWPELALPIAQAPLLMFIAIAAVEMKALAVKPDARPRLISDDDRGRALDALRFNATRVLTRIAARRGLSTGDLTLVVEQSELARISPLTLVSVQRPAPDPEVLDLSPEDRETIAEGLFDETLTERALHLVSLRDGENLHVVSLDTSAISAHARVAALVDAAPTSTSPA